jgi:hypothetical protein
LCWVHSPKRPRACAGIRPATPRGYRGQRSPQDPLPSRPIHSSRTKRLYRFWMYSTRRTRSLCRNYRPTPPQTPPRGIWGRYRSPQKPVPTVGIPTGVPCMIRRRLRLWILKPWLWLTLTPRVSTGYYITHRGCQPPHVWPVKDQPGTPRHYMGRQRPPRHASPASQGLIETGLKNKVLPSPQS